ncbi:MAG: universal stress protein [Trebonia sp.]
MTVLRRGIVAGYDGSIGSEQALRWAADEARARACTLTVCLAWAPQYLTMLADKVVYDVARRRGDEILARGVRHAASAMGTGQVTPLLARGPATSVLCEQSAGAQMVVLGARGNGGVPGLAVGSVAWQVAGHAHGPIVVVRGRARLHNSNAGPVVAGADGSAVSDDVLRFAFHEAELRRVPLLAVCALADASAMIGGAQQVEADFSHLTAIQEKENPDVTLLRQVLPGSPRAALMEAAAGAQLLVVGSRGRGGLQGMTLGSTAVAMLHHAPCPVAVVHA